MDPEQQEQFCFSLLEDELHANFAKNPFVEEEQFTNLFQELNLYCEPYTGREDNKPLVVMGETGIGKSAAIAHWASVRRVGNSSLTRNRLDPAEFVFYHAIGCSRLSTQVVQLLRRLVNSIISHFQIKDVMNLADEKLPWILPRLLEKASKKGRLIICIDGLHHICSNDKDYGLLWLPTHLPSGVKIIVSATTPIIITPTDSDQPISDHSKRFQVKIQQTWNEINRRKYTQVTLECMKITSVANYIDKYLSLDTNCPQQLVVDMKLQVIETIGSNPLATNQQFVNVFLRGLCHAIGLGYNVNQCLIAWMPCRTIVDLFEQIFILFEAGGSSSCRLGSLLGDSLSLLFVARHGLHERELMDLLRLVHKQSDWNVLTEGTAIPIKLKILQMLLEDKQRLIDVFRSFDTDGSGTLSRDELYAGMERLDIDVNHEEIILLIDDADENGDGEIDYQELLAKFENQARSYSHGKRRGSVFGHEQNLAVFLTDDQKGHLIAILRCVGVCCMDRGGSVLTLPVENPALRDAVWKKYITNETNESKYRKVLIEMLSKNDPSLRYCEELPWHLMKEYKWKELKQVLVDLRTLDIMFYNVEMKSELFSFLKILSIGEGAKAVTFDIIADYSESSSCNSTNTLISSLTNVLSDRSVQHWHQRNNPSSKHLSLMCIFIADVMAWFDSGIISVSLSPPFLRERVDDEWLAKLGIDASANDGFKSPEGKRIQSDAHYFFHRWLWIMFPWIAITSSTEPETVLAAPQPTTADKENVSAVIPPVDMLVSVRDQAMINAKANKLSYAIKSPKIATSLEIPAELLQAEIPSQVARDAAKKLRELKSIHDKLTLEADCRERQYKESIRAQTVRRTGNAKSSKSIARGEEVLAALQSRLEQMDCLIDQATNVDLKMNDILLALHSSEPTHSHQSELESQIRLCRQQIVDLQTERGVILKETEITDARSKKLEEGVKQIIEDRQRIKPHLDNLRSRAIELDLKKITRPNPNFDAEAFSRRARIEGKLAKRREELRKRNASFEVIDVNKLSALHPMERIALIAGRDPNVIAAMLNESEMQKLRQRQEQAEQHVKDQVAKLEHLDRQINQILMSDGNTGSAVVVEYDTEALLTDKQKRLEKMSRFIDSLYLAVLHVSDKVRTLELTGGIQFSHFLTVDDDHIRLYKDAKRLIESTKTLSGEIPLEFIAIAKKMGKGEDEIEHLNVRVLNREEKVS